MKDPEPLPQLVPNSFGRETCEAISPLDRAFAIADTATVPKARQGRRWTLCHTDEIAPGERRIFELGSLSIGVFNLGGKFYAIKNVCPHIGAPLCRRSIHGTHRPGDINQFDPALHGRVLRCPWHGWEFDIITGKGLYDAQGRVATYPTETTPEGQLVVTV
jgi:nitrite reductase (NADH) small subunit